MRSLEDVDKALQKDILKLIKIKLAGVHSTDTLKIKTPEYPS